MLTKQQPPVEVIDLAEHLPETVTLDEGAIKAVRCALLDGLLCYGEYERLHNAAKCIKPPKRTRPRHPTGDAATVTRIADALYYLEGKG